MTIARRKEGISDSGMGKSSSGSVSVLRACPYFNQSSILG